MAYFLNAGNLISGTTCTVGNYKIEWRLDSREGDVVLISGNTGNTDPEIDARHPLINEIVIGGTLYPVIIYVYLDGDKYTSELEVGAYHSPDLYDCLDPIIVEVIDCTTSLNPTADYQFTLSRASNVGEKSRSIKFNIGATTNYMAWEFTAVSIPDQLNVYYCTAGDPNGELIDSILLGDGVTPVFAPTNYPRQSGYDPNSPVTPIAFAWNSPAKYVSDLTPFTYQAGDWIKFEILGNVLNPTQNETAWNLKIQCLDALDLSNNFEDVGKIDLSSLTVTDNTDSCRLEVSYKNIDGLYTPNNDASIFLRRYFYFSALSGVTLLPNSTGANTIVSTTGGITTYKHVFPYTFSLSTSTITSGWSSQICTDLNDNDLYDSSMSVFKNSANFVLSFTDINDYNLVKTNIEYVQASSAYTAYLSAVPTEVEYYGFYVFKLKIGTDCDTVDTTPDYYLHWSTPISYDLANKKITFTMSSLTNSLPDPINSCDKVKGQVGNIIGPHNLLYANNSINYVTYVRGAGIGGGLPNGIGMTSQVLSATQRTAYRAISTYPILLNNLVDLTSYGFCTNGNVLSLYVYYDRVNITDINNYTLERRESLETNNCSHTDYEIVAQKP